MPPHIEFSIIQIMGVAALNCVLIVLSVMLLSACSGSEPTPTAKPVPTSTPTPAPTSTPTPVPAAEAIGRAPQEILQEAMTALRDSESFHFELGGFIRTSVGDTQVEIPLTFVGDFQDPDRLSGELVMFLGIFPLTIKTVTIGDSSFATSLTTGEWEAVTSTVAGILSPLSLVEDSIAALADVVLVGVETLNETRVYHLRGVPPAGVFGGPDAEAQVNLLIGVEDALVRQVAAVGQVDLGVFSDILGRVGFSDTGAISVTARFYKYGEPVTIEAPQISSGVVGSEGPGQRLPDQGRQHISPGTDHPPYSSVPATSGWHYSAPLAPAAWGVHDKELPDEVLVHNLEHGGVGVHYDCPNGCDDLVQELSDIVREFDKVIMSPYPGMDRTIALTAWTFLDEFDDFDEARIREFIRAHEGSSNSPESKAP